MILRHLTILLIVVIFSSAPVFSQESSPDTMEFKRVLYDLLVSLEGVAEIEPDASLVVLESSAEEMEEMLHLIQDKETFLTSAQRVIDRIASARTLVDDKSAVAEVTVSTPSPLTCTAFPPDYPPGSGLYFAKIVGELKLYNLLSSHDERCNSAALADYWSIWWEAHELAEIADGFCTFVGCDPSGIGCAIGCGLLELYVKAVVLAQRPLELCSFHDANIDSAELQAGYENSVCNMQKLADISSKLDQQKGMLESVLANQQTIIKLLNTPQGRRPDWNEK